jgi:hypothetical protein
VKLLWLMVTPDRDSTTPQKLEEFKRYYRCAASSDSIGCFRADYWHIYSIQSGEKVEGTDIAALVRDRLFQISPDTLQKRLNPGESISLTPLDSLKPLYAPANGVDTGLGPNYRVSRIVSDRAGWELTIEDAENNRAATVRLDTQRHPVSGRMIRGEVPYLLKKPR